MPAARRDRVAERVAERIVAGGLRQAGLVALASAAATLASLVVTLVVARSLTTRQYGAFIELLAVFLVLSMPGSAIQVGVIRRVAAWESAGMGHLVVPWAQHWYIRLLGVVTSAVVLTALVQGWAARQLSLPGSGGLVAMVAAGAAWGILSIDRGLIQARRAYPLLAANLLVEGIVKAAAVIGLAASGLGVAGAAVGVLIAEVAAVVHARYAVARTASQPVARDVLADPPTRRHLAGDVGSALSALALLAVLQNFDLVLLGREAPRRAGAYAAISVAAKTLAFAAIALSLYLLPEAAIRHQRGGHALRPLATTLALLAVPAVPLLAAALFVPRTTLDVVFGQRLAGAAGSFAVLVVAMIFLSVTVVLTNYLLGAGWRWVPGLLAAAAGIGSWLASRAAGSYGRTAAVDLEVQAALAVAVAAVFVVALLRRPTSR